VTVMIRQDRFVEGSLYGDYRSGLIANVLRRAAELEAELPKVPRKPRKKADGNQDVEAPEL